jgi:hypothetical protein
MSIPWPISLTDEQLSAIYAASVPLAPHQRSPFLADCATALAQLPEIGDGAVHRIVMVVQRKYFDPPQFATDNGGKYDGKYNRLPRRARSPA